MIEPFSRHVDKTREIFADAKEPLRFQPNTIPLEKETLHPFTRRLYQRFVLLSIDAVQDWDNWAKALMPSPRKNLQLGLVRAAKGLIKLFRVWLIETYQLERSAYLNKKK
jgi:hypothetical protein